MYLYKVRNLTITKRKTVLIAGAGQLGSRYLQSLVSSTELLDIHLLSLDSKALKLCAERWHEVGGNKTSHRTFNHCTLHSIPAMLDLVVVASTAEMRPQLVEAIAQDCHVRFWVIEKVLSQNLQGLKRINEAVAGSKDAWVNYYMSSQKLYKEVKDQLTGVGPKDMVVCGGDWGLACNAQHFVHLHCWFNDSPLVEFDKVSLAKRWHAAKRAGVWEVYGELQSVCQNGGRLQMNAKAGNVHYEMRIQSGDTEWVIFEEQGIARSSKGIDLAVEVYYQSQRPLLLDILAEEKCELPRLESVLEADGKFLEVMLNSWRQAGNLKATSVPIT